MYSGHGRLCVCLSLCLSLAAFPLYCTDPDVTWRNGRGCPLVVHYLADLQSVDGFRCYDNTTPNTKCQRVLVLAVCLALTITAAAATSRHVTMHLTFDRDPNQQWCRPLGGPGAAIGMLCVCSNICKHFDIWRMDKQISARQSKFNLKYCASESAVCRAISKLR